MPEDDSLVDAFATSLGSKLEEELHQNDASMRPYATVTVEGGKPHTYTCAEAVTCEIDLKIWKKLGKKTSVEYAPASADSP